MKFKEFITRQRVSILVVGGLTFVVSLLIAHLINFRTLWGDLFIDLAASAVTIVFTALIIDYIGAKEQSVKTQNAAELAEDEIKITCSRIKWRLAQLFGLQRRKDSRQNISSQEEARAYLQSRTDEVDEYLETHRLMSEETILDPKAFQPYMDRLQSAQNELEQTLLLYEYALSYTLRERILALRREIQTAERVLGFIDTTESLNKNNRSLIRVTAQSVYEGILIVLDHDSRSADADSIHTKSVGPAE
jgi:DNA repair exonuclease SbcCD ATPase subunit